ncbi:MAG: orotate phosphoribosyltransferase [Bacteroidales bacterium]|nr:orotate phosphoribosyltransferase [Bacteroidales bacterium]
MNNEKKLIAKLLLQSKAIKLNPATPFTWASGLKSPIYCDNRITLSFPETRAVIKNQFAAIIKEKYAQAEGIAGVATGAIAQGALVAEVLNLPFVYVRSSPKSHGLENLIEGKVNAGQKVVVVEDLISTGGSSLKAVDALRNVGCEVLGMVAIFTYGFPFSEESFTKSGCELTTLSDYNTLLTEAMDSGYIRSEDLEILSEWRTNPEKWSQNF